MRPIVQVTAALQHTRDCIAGGVAALIGVVENSASNYSSPLVDRIWGVWGSYYNIPKAIFYLLRGLYTLNPKKNIAFSTLFSIISI